MRGMLGNPELSSALRVVSMAAMRSSFDRCTASPFEPWTARPVTPACANHTACLLIVWVSRFSVPLSKKHIVGTYTPGFSGRRGRSLPPFSLTSLWAVDIGDMLVIKVERAFQSFCDVFSSFLKEEVELGF
ncbi:hypothetical protein I7I48_11826 [Histoplasma ohiense]|nr:hypothetical protein I7I48_11826 [Histoplasma ohiense (nom. inval.)]